MEQDKIDVARAIPVPEIPVVPPRRGAPLWLQMLLSLVVIVVAAGIAALFLPSANAMLGRVGIALPLLTAAADNAAPGAGNPAGQIRPGAQQQAQAPQGQSRPGGQASNQAGGRPGGFGGNRTAVVVAAPVTTALINNQLTAIGEGSAIRAVIVTSASGGTLVSVDVKAGDTVAAGAKLATLDAAAQQNAYDRAGLALDDANAALERARSLATTNSIPATQLDAARLAAGNAKLALEAAQIALDQRSITTPIAGMVGLIQVSPGNQINAQTVVTTIEDSSEILVNFWVPERYSSQIAVGMPVTAKSAALPGKSFEGKVSAVDNKIDPASRTLQVQATLPNPDGTIKAGMSFAVDMSFPGETFPAVDPLSIQWSNKGPYVWKVVDGKATKGMVEIIQRNTDGVLVNGDVKPGDSVVTQGVLQLSDGATVRLLDAAQGGDASAAPEGGTRQGQPPQAGAGPPPGNGANTGTAQGGQGGQYKKRQGQPGGAAAPAPAAGG